jgi:hypothetical protein
MRDRREGVQHRANGWVPLAFPTFSGLAVCGSARMGVASVSDRLDIVRLIDSKVTASRRMVVRSKQLADAARDDLDTHKEWLERHREQAREDQERHQRRLKRKHRFESWKRLAISTVLFLPRLCVAAYRGVASSLSALDRLFFAGCAWIVQGAGAVGTGLIVFLADHLAWTGTKLLTLAVWVTAGLWLGLSLLGKGARDAGVSAYATGSHGLSWLGPRALSFGNALVRFLSLGASRLAILTRDVGIKIGRGIERQIVTLSARWQPDSGPPDARRADLDPRRLQQAAFVRLRAEHDRLQNRIRTLDQQYTQRAPGRRSNGTEWADVRRLGLNARRLLEVQEGQLLDPAARDASGTQLPPQKGRVQAPVHPLLLGHAFYEAPVLRADRRRSRP